MKTSSYTLLAALVTLCTSAPCAAQDIGQSLDRLRHNLNAVRVAARDRAIEPEVRTRITTKVAAMQTCRIWLRRRLVPHLLDEDIEPLIDALDAHGEEVLLSAAQLPGNPAEAEATVDEISLDLSEKCNARSDGEGISPAIAMRRDVEVTTIDETNRPMPGYYVEARPSWGKGTRYAVPFGQTTNPASTARLTVGYWLITATKGSRQFDHKIRVESGKSAPYKASVVVAP